MDNQHKRIKGYRDLSQAEIDLMNEIKAKAEECGSLVDRLQALQRHPQDKEGAAAFYIDGRWAAIGRTHLQEGFMALVRSVAQPTSF